MCASENSVEKQLKMLNCKWSITHALYTHRSYIMNEKFIIFICLFCKLAKTVMFNSLAILQICSML